MTQRENKLYTDWIVSLLIVIILAIISGRYIASELLCDFF